GADDSRTQSSFHQDSRCSGQRGAGRGDDVEILERKLGAGPQRYAEFLPVAGEVGRHECEKRRDDRVTGLHAMNPPRLVETDIGAAGRTQGIEIEPKQIPLGTPTLLRIHSHSEEIAHIAQRRALAGHAPVYETDSAP